VTDSHSATISENFLPYFFNVCEVVQTHSATLTKQIEPCSDTVTKLIELLSATVSNVIELYPILFVTTVYSFPL